MFAPAALARQLLCDALGRSDALLRSELASTRRCVRTLRNSISPDLIRWASTRSVGQLPAGGRSACSKTIETLWPFVMCARMRGRGSTAPRGGRTHRAHRRTLRSQALVGAYAGSSELGATPPPRPRSSRPSASPTSPRPNRKRISRNERSNHNGSGCWGTHRGCGPSGSILTGGWGQGMLPRCSRRSTVVSR